MNTLAVTSLLVRLRWRSLWNAALGAPPAGAQDQPLWRTLWKRRAPRRTSRIAWLLVLLAPVAYVGLFSTAFGVVAEVAAPAQQAAFLALVVGTITVASAAAKTTSGDAIVGGSAENEFLLARPLSLSTLVLARSLAGVATDIFDALFLLPVLVAASLVWRLGIAGVLCAALISVIVQIGVSAFAQASQILLVRLVAPARRRAVGSAMALLAALTMACLWVLASWVLRQPVALVEKLGAWTDVLRFNPGRSIVAPLVAMSEGRWQTGWLALAAPLELSVIALLLAHLAVSWAGRAGWEQAGTPWAEAARAPERAAARMTPFSKDWYLLVRDRTRLVRLLALPAIFVGIQIFGSVGWSWTTATPARIAVLTYSLAAYMATFGPLGHMEAERSAFWIVRVAPVSLDRLLAAKALFWSAIIGGVACLCGYPLLLFAPAPLTAEGVGLVALAGVGAVTACWLAVAMAAGVADFSDDRRALGLGTVYLFLLVAGLFNVVLLESGEARVRALVLYLAAVALYWMTGVKRASEAYDPETRLDRSANAGAGATFAILLFLGTRAERLTFGAADAALAETTWAALLAAAAVLYLTRARFGRSPSRRWWLSWVTAVALGALAGLPLFFSTAAPLSLMAALAHAAVEELGVRGIAQPALATRWPRARLAAPLLASLLTLVAGARPLGFAALVVAVVPSVTLAWSGRISAAVLTRLILEAALALR